MNYLNSNYTVSSPDNSPQIIQITNNITGKSISIYEPRILPNPPTLPFFLIINALNCYLTHGKPTTETENMSQEALNYAQDLYTHISPIIPDADIIALCTYFYNAINGDDPEND
jgi:hypothetical protein